MFSDQSLDHDTFQSILSHDSDNDPHFYEKFFPSLETSGEWKSFNDSSATPEISAAPTTPRTTNEKSVPDDRFPSWSESSSGYGSFFDGYSLSMPAGMHHHPQFPMNNYNHNNNCSQLVPEVLQDHGNEPWFYNPLLSMSSPIEIPRKQNNNSMYKQPRSSQFPSHEFLCMDSPYSPFPASSEGLEEQLRTTSYFTNTHLDLQHTVGNQTLQTKNFTSPPTKSTRANHFNSYSSNVPSRDEHGYLRFPDGESYDLLRSSMKKYSYNDSGFKSRSMSSIGCEERYDHQLASEKMRKQNNSNTAEHSSRKPELSRTGHNVLERQRRRELNYLLNILKDNIPGMEGAEKVSQIHVLKEARQYIEKLHRKEQSIMNDLELEKVRKFSLETRFERLKHSC